MAQGARDLLKTSGQKTAHFGGFGGGLWVRWEGVLSRVLPASAEGTSGTAS